MKDKDFYNKNIAQNYDNDSFGILRSAHEAALETLKPVLGDIEEPRVLDVPCGTGNFLTRLRDDYPKAELCGLDLSAEMVEIARDKLGAVDLRVGSALNICDEFGAESFDLACLHYVFGFVDSQELLKRTHQLVKKGGHVSVLTSTWESLPRMRSLLFKVLPKSIIEGQAYCPKSPEELSQWAQTAGFEMIESRELVVDIKFADYRQFYRYAHDEGWFTQYFYWIPTPLRDKVLPRLLDWTVFPLEDQSISSISVLRKH